jgi:MFS family permease
MYDQTELSDTLSGLFNGAFSIGTIIGPLIASYLTLGTNFSLCCDIFAIMTFGFALLYFLVVYIPLRKEVSKIQLTSDRKKSHN